MALPLVERLVLRRRAPVRAVARPALARISAPPICPLRPLVLSDKPDRVLALLSVTGLLLAPPLALLPETQCWRSSLAYVGGCSVSWFHVRGIETGKSSNLPFHYFSTTATTTTATTTTTTTTVP